MYYEIVHAAVINNTKIYLNITKNNNELCIDYEKITSYNEKQMVN
jgi:hypothetical protein